MKMRRFLIKMKRETALYLIAYDKKQYFDISFYEQRDGHRDFCLCLERNHVKTGSFRK